MPRLHHRRRTDLTDETPDWGWTADADMPSGRDLEEQILRDRRSRGRRCDDTPVDHEHPLPLSPQQHDVLVCLSLGLTTPVAAGTLGLTVPAVMDSLKQIRRKLGARNAPHAVAIAYRAGLIE